jgi:plasmid stability protein
MDEILILRIDSDKKTELRVAAARRNMSMGKWVRECIEDHLKDDQGVFFDGIERKRAHTECVDNN